MATQGVRFEQYYAGSSVGVPGNCSLLTGLHTGHCAIRGDAPKVQKVEVFTVAEALWQANYTTGMIGRWALGDYTPEASPNSQGYDYSYGYLNNEHAKTAYPKFLYRNGQRVDIAANLGEHPNTLADFLFKDEAILFMQQNRRRPFFLHVGFVSPRAALTALPKDSPFKNRPWTEDQKCYADVVRRLDGYVGEILETIRRLELDRRTIVFFTSDNGPPDNEVTRFFSSAGGLRGGKGTLYEGGIRAPMIVWGRRFPAGIIVSTPTAAWDFFPTAMELAEAWQRPRNLDGVHLLRVLSGDSKSIHEAFYWELHDGGFSQCTRQNSWKGVDPSPRVGTQLYDLSQRQGQEDQDLSKLQADVVKQHSELKQRARTPNPLWQTPGE
ncbi:Arylsulfatase precursor [Anatilimnocola aggregata]|uniref:Arylsulfatase n=2 Tax=Anatilimnocola aggregata TaxID=2528021 RepID=A0A517YEY9_9BACT|nr:Arylsulfatase precursor [Anatilimnocola aggregata]